MPAHPSPSPALSPAGRPAQRPGAWTAAVRVLRVLFPTAAAILFATLVAWPLLSEDQVAPSQGPLKNEMTAPSFSTRDEQDRPVTVTAEAARQVDQAQTKFELDQAAASLGLPDGTAVGLSAAAGAFDRTTELLGLSGGVDLTHSGGFRLSVETASVDTGKRLAWSLAPTRGEGPAGRLEAAGFRYEAATKRLVFTGPVRMVIHPRALADLNPRPAPDPQGPAPIR